jgi:hypothetical protein
MQSARSGCGTDSLVVGDPIEHVEHRVGDHALMLGVEEASGVFEHSVLALWQ